MPTAGRHVARQADDQIPAVGPFHAHPTIVLIYSLHQTRRDMEIRPNDLSGIGVAFEVSPRQITEWLCGGGKESLRTQPVQIQAGVSGASFLHSHEPLRIGGESEARRVVVLLRLEQGQRVLVPRPELPAIAAVGS